MASTHNPDLHQWRARWVNGVNMANMLHKTMEGDVVLAVHNQLAPSDAEWAAFIADIATIAEQKGIDKIRHLIITEGGSPSSAQRKQINDALAGQSTRVAVVTDSRLARMATTAISWFNRGIVAFSPDKLEAAFHHLEIPTGLRPKVVENARKMLTELDAKLRL